VEPNHSSHRYISQPLLLLLLLLLLLHLFHALWWNIRCVVAP